MNNLSLHPNMPHSYIVAWSASLLLFCLASAVSAEGALPTHLTSSNFVETLKNNRAVVVMFYASWCSISQKLLQPFDEIYEEMQQLDVMVAKVDCIAEPDLYWQHDIKGFPTFGLFANGESIYFEGEPTIENIKQWIKLTAVNSVTELNPKIFYELDLKTKPLAVEFLDENSAVDAGASAKFDFACKKFSFPHCYTSRSRELADLLGVPMPSIVMIKEYNSYAPRSAPQEMIEVSTKEHQNSDEVLQWMQSVSFPTLVEHSEANAPLLFFDKRPGFAVHLILFVNKRGTDDTQAILRAGDEVGQEFMGRAVVAYVDCDSKLSGEGLERAQNLMEDTEITLDEVPTAAIIYSAGSAMKFYKYPSGTDLTKEALSHWMTQFLDKKLKHSKIVGEEHQE